LHGERDNARNNARCTQARKTTHDLDGQHQYVDRTLCRRVSQRTDINGESTSMVWPTLVSRMAKEQNRTLILMSIHHHHTTEGDVLFQSVPAKYAVFCHTGNDCPTKS